MTLATAQVEPAASISPGDWTRALFEAIDDAVFVHDLEGNLLEANPAACRRLGYSRDEVLRLKTYDIDAPDFASGFPERLKRQLATGRFRCEGRHRTKDGRIIPVDINTSAVTLNGKPAVLAVIRDITEHKLAEDALARQTELLTSILNNMADAVVVADLDKTLLVCNPAAVRLFGLGSANQALARPFDTRGLYLPDRVTPFPPGELPLARSIRGEEVDNVEVFVRRPHAPSGLWISATGRPLRDAQGNIKGGVVVCRDFTEGRRSSSRLAAQYAVARALAEGDSVESASQDILRVLCETLGTDVGILWLVDADQHCLTCVQTWPDDSQTFPLFLEATHRISLDVERDLPGQAWSTGRHQSLHLDHGTERLPLRCRLAQQEGLRVSHAFPIQGSAGVTGIIELLSRAADASDDDLISLMNSVASQLGQVLERRHVEKALRDSEALYHSLVESLPQNVFRKDLQGRVTFANGHYCKTLRMSLKELLGKTDFDLFPPELAAKYVDDDRKVLQSGETFETVEAHHLPDGRTIYVQVVKTPVYDAQGQIVGIQGIFWDVTERKRGEEILAESERRYRQLTEAMLDGILLVDQDERIRLFNPAAERMFGYSAEEVVGKPASLLLPPEMRDAAGRGFFHYLENRQSHIIGRTTEIRALRKDGGEFPAEVALSMVTFGRGLDGTPVDAQFLCAIRDLTERNRLRSVLVQSEKLASIGLLSAGVAHEINNPLAFVANNLAVLDRDWKGILKLLDHFEAAKERLRVVMPEFVDDIVALEEELDIGYTRENLARLIQRTRDGVDRVTRIVHSLRGLARTDAPKLQETNLPDLIENSLEILRGRYKRSGIHVHQDHDADPKVSCVQTQISQVILNLLVNAFQAVESFRPEGGLIEIRTRRLAHELLLEVKDNGPGIVPEHQARLFDPFFTTKDVGEGTGLGLSITHNIVSAHGGRIEVESQPGHGACFRIYLPLKPIKEK